MCVSKRIFGERKMRIIYLSTESKKRGAKNSENMRNNIRTYKISLKLVLFKM